MDRARWLTAIVSLTAIVGFGAERADFVELKTVVPGVALDLRYATRNNFTHERVYERAVCLVRRGTAEKLALVDRDLAAKGLALKMFDCYRPLSVQKKFWALVPDERYVANPAKGSRHNRGAALDLTLVRRGSGRELPMGTGFDDFTERAHRDFQDLPADEAANRKTLQEAMERRGFVPFPTEWWHFDDADWERYPIADSPLR